MRFRVPFESFLNLQKSEILTLSQVSDLAELVQVSLIVEIEPKANLSGPVQKPDSYVMMYGRRVEIGCLAQLSKFVAGSAGGCLASLHVFLDLGITLWKGLGSTRKTLVAQ